MSTLDTVMMAAGILMLAVGVFLAVQRARSGTAAKDVGDLRAWMKNEFAAMETRVTNIIHEHSAPRTTAQTLADMAGADAARFGPPVKEGLMFITSRDHPGIDPVAPAASAAVAPPSPVAPEEPSPEPSAGSGGTVDDALAKIDAQVAALQAKRQKIADAHRALQDALN